MFGSVIALIVSALKGIAVVKRYPKIAATILAALATGWQLTHTGASPDLAHFLHCLSTQLAGAVLTHEAVDTARGKRAL